MPDIPDPESAEGRHIGEPYFSQRDKDRDFVERDRLNEAVREAVPGWLKDGLGIRGPQGPPKRTEDEVRRTDFDRGSVVRPNQVTNVTEVDGGADLPGDPVDIYGAYNGAPAVFHLLQTEAPTPV